MANIFLTGTFNIYFSETSTPNVRKHALANAVNIATELIQRGISLETTPEIVESKLKSYAFEHIASFGLDSTKFTDAVLGVVEAVVDMYDDYILPHVKENLAKSKHVH